MKLIVDGVIFTSSPYGGISRVFNNILPLMCDLDPQLKVIVFFLKKSGIQIPKHKQITYINLKNIYHLRPWRLWKPHYVDIQQFFLKLLIGNSKNKIWFSTYFTRPQFVWKGKEVVFTHDFIYELYPDLMPVSQAVIHTKSEAINAADMIFCNSNTTASDLQKFYDVPSSNIIVSHLGFDKVFRLRKDTLSIDILPYRFILFVGKRNYYKGFDTLLAAFSEWSKTHDFKLVLVGPPLSNAEKSTLNELTIEGKIVVFDNPEDDVLCDLYNQATALIYPSIYEGFGIPLLEAMACGCLIVASRIPSTVEVAENVPYYFEPGDIDSLTRSLNELVSLDDRKTKIEMGLQRASYFSWEKTALIIYNGVKKLDSEKEQQL